MEELIGEIAAHWSAHRSLTGCASISALLELKTIADVQAARSRLFRQEISVADLSADPEGGKVSAIYSRDSWSIFLLRNFVVDPDIVLTPYPTILFPFDETTTFSVRSYEMEDHQFRRSRLDDPKTVAVQADKVISFGDVWMTPKMGVSHSIRAITEESMILVINGPPYAPYTHVLNSDMEYANSSFSSNVYNAKVFFSDLVKHTVESGLPVSCSPEELEVLRKFIRKTTLDPDSVSEEIWPLVQAISAVDDETAIDILSRLGSSAHEISTTARAVLSANEIPLHVISS